VIVNFTSEKLMQKVIVLEKYDTFIHVSIVLFMQSKFSISNKV